jgi:hypothetical protein
MSVDIPISANAGTVVSALNQIRTAISQASGEAKNFAQIDLSHSEVGKLSAEIKTVLKNFEDLVRLGRGGTAAGVRSALTAGGISPASLAAGGDTERLRALTVWADHVGRQFPDAAERRRNINNVVGHVTGGTSLGADPEQSPALPARQSSGGSPSSPSLPARQSESFFKRHGRAAGGGLGSLFGGGAGEAVGGGLGAAAGALIPELALPLLALAGVQSVGKLVGTAYTQAQGEDKADDSLLRTIQGSGDDFGKLRDAAREASKGLMLTYEQSARLGATFAQIANISDPAAAFKGMQQAVGFGNAYGIDAQTATTSFAQASLLGMDPERFATLIAAATAAGNDKSQTPQVMQAILSFAQTASRYLVISGAVNGATGNFASVYAAMQATDQPGLMGANGSALLGQINAATMSGGAAGMPGQIATYQAFARAGITDPYAVQYDLSGGAFAPITMAGGKQTDAYNIMGSYFDQYGRKGSLQREYAESQYYGINMRQAGAMESISGANLDALPGQLDTYGINADQLNMAALPGIVGLLNNPGSAASVKKSLLANGALSKKDADAINSAGSDPKALMKALVQGLNDTGLQQTDSTKNTQAITDLNNAITGAGSGLVPIVTKLTGGMSDLLTPVKELSKDLDILLGMNSKSADSKANAKLASMGVTSNPGRGGLHAYGLTPNPGAATRGLRNNNPLNLGAGAGGAGMVGSDGRFGMYDTQEDGITAAVRQVRRYETGAYDGTKHTTLASIDRLWTPRNGENPNADSQLSAIEKYSGLNDASDLTDQNKLALYLQFKAIAESGASISPAQASAAVKAGYNGDTTHTVVLKMQHLNGQTTTHPVPSTGAPVIVPYNMPGHA